MLIFIKAVTNRNEWVQITADAGGKEQMAKIKGFYLKYLFPYEKRNYFGSENDDEFPNLILGAPRKINKNETNSTSAKPKNEEYTNLQN